MTKTRFISFVLSLVFVFSLFSMPTAFMEEEKVLNLFTWELYVDADTISQFEKETGIKVNYTSFATNEEMLIKLQNMQGGSYDVIIASDYILNMARKGELLSKLDLSLLPNYKNLDENYLSNYYDENNEYTVPYIVGTPLIVYDPAVVPFEMKGYNDLFDPRLEDSVVVIDDARNIVGITLMSMGYTLNETEDDILQKAADKLPSLRKNIRSFNSDTGYVDLLSGECSVAYMFTPYVIMAMQENPDLKVVFPEEGLGVGIDSMVIPVNAPHKQNAHKLINFILDAQIGAQVAENQLFVTPNRESKSFLSEEMLNNPALYIDSTLMEGAQFMQDVGEVESKYQDIYTTFKLSEK